MAESEAATERERRRIQKTPKRQAGEEARNKNDHTKKPRIEKVDVPLDPNPTRSPSPPPQSPPPQSPPHPTNEKEERKLEEEIAKEQRKLAELEEEKRLLEEAKEKQRAKELQREEERIQFEK